MADLTGRATPRRHPPRRTVRRRDARGLDTVGALAVALVLAVAPPAHAAGDAQATGASDAPADAARSGPAVGVMTDIGVPDGLVAALVLRATDRWRFHAGGGTNTVSAGYRAGVSMFPTGRLFSVNFEAGGYREGEANDFVRGLTGLKPRLRPLVRRLGYTYASGQVGIDLGTATAALVVRAGVSFVRARLGEVGEALTANADSSNITVKVYEDPIIRVWMPSIKAGLVFTFR